MTRISLLILFVLEGTLLVAAFIYDPKIFENPASMLQIGWVMLLLLANWLASTLIFIKNKDKSKSPDFGVVPAINISVFAWSILSLLAMILLQDISVRLHFVVQVILSGAIAFLVLSMLLGSAGAQIDISAPKVSKSDLAMMIKQLENNNPQVADSLKALREEILYNLPHESKLANSVDYQELIKRVQLANENSETLYDNSSQSLKNIVENCRNL